MFKCRKVTHKCWSVEQWSSKTCCPATPQNLFLSPHTPNKLPSHPRKHFVTPPRIKKIPPQPVKKITTTPNRSTLKHSYVERYQTNPSHECIPTAVAVRGGGGLQIPGDQAAPWDQAPPPGPDISPGTRDPPPGTDSPVNRMTDRCKNITLPQTSSAGGKNRFRDLCVAQLKPLGSLNQV